MQPDRIWNLLYRIGDSNGISLPLEEERDFLRCFELVLDQQDRRTIFRFELPAVIVIIPLNISKFAPLPGDAAVGKEAANYIKTVEEVKKY